MARNINALIVEDSKVSRKIIMKSLQETGLGEFNFTEAEDGVEALVKFDPKETDIIFMDMHMPRMDGIECVAELRLKYAKCPPIVMITAESSREKLAEALNDVQVDAFMLKPVDVVRMYEGLKKIINTIPDRDGAAIVPHGEYVYQSLQEILREMCDLALTREPENEKVRSGDIVYGMVSILGELQWSISLGFTRAAASEIACLFGGMEKPCSDEDLGDAISELTNIVAGRIKHHLCNKGLAVQISLPTVMAATDFRILVVRKQKSTADYVQFDSPVGKIWTSLATGIHTGIVL